MGPGDFQASEKSLTIEKAGPVKIQLVADSGKTTVLKEILGQLEQWYQPQAR